MAKAHGEDDPVTISQIRRMTPAEATAAADRVTQRSTGVNEYLDDIERARILTRDDLDTLIV